MVAAVRPGVIHAAHVDLRGPRRHGQDCLRLHRRRAVAASIMAPIGNHRFPAIGIIAYLADGGALEYAQAMAAHERVRTRRNSPIARMSA
jgi:hypothetical protein